MTTGSSPQPRKSPVAWESLSRARQLSVLTRLCMRRGPQLKRAHDGILSIGVGYKTSGGQRLPRLCLAFLVYRKRKVRYSVPPTIDAYETIGGRRVRLRVPTDVEEAHGGEPQAAINAAAGILVAAAADPSLRCTGAVCCVVKQRNTPSNRYFLGCHHVLALSSRLQHCGTTHGLASCGGVDCAELFESVPMVPNVESQTDAAIALIAPGADVTWSHGGARPSRIASAVEEPVGCSVFTPRGAVPADYVKTWIQVPLWYPSCGWVCIGRAYQFQAQTQPGDSGSPVMDQAGAVFGMHFWGRPADAFAMAIPAASLFRDRLFSVAFDLAT